MRAITEPPTTGWRPPVNLAGPVATPDSCRLISAVSTPGHSFHLEPRPLPGPTYEIIARLETIAPAPLAGLNQTWAGVGLRDSASGKFFGMFLTNSAGGPCVQGTRWNSPTAWAANLGSVAAKDLAEGRVPNWFRLRSDGALRYYDIGYNGQDWMLFGYELANAFITPDEFVWGGEYMSTNASGLSQSIRLRSYEERI